MGEALRVFRHIEDDDVRVELRGGQPFTGRAVSCSTRYDPFRCLRRPDGRHARLDILFESIKGRSNGAPMGDVNTIILAYKRRHTNGLSWLEGEIPAGAMPPTPHRFAF